MTAKEILSRIRTLHVPDRVKTELVKLSKKAKGLVVKILRFLRRHPHFTECLLLGAIVAYLLSYLPYIGHFLGLVALATSAATGLMRELKASFRDFFGEIRN